jgi:hypothetical protein
MKERNTQKKKNERIASLTRKNKVAATTITHCIDPLT